jgi:hypothetical protein
MKVEIGTEAAQFPEKEYINGIFFAVPSKLLISSYFWEKTFFCGKLSFGNSMIFSGIEVCTAMA